MLTVDEMAPAARAAVSALVDEVTIDHHHLSFNASETGSQLTRVIDCLRAHDIIIHAIEGQPPTLEEVFTLLTHEQE
jgi:hypothetical protein